MVRVDTTVNDTCYDTLSCVSLWEVDTLVYFVDTDFLPHDVHLLVHTAWQFHTADSLQSGDTLYVSQRHHDNGDIATHPEYLHALCLKFGTSVLPIELNHCHRVRRDALRAFKGTCAAVVSRN